MEVVFAFDNVGAIIWVIGAINASAARRAAEAERKKA